MIKFYDTCALLQAGESAFDETFIISSITLEELEHIKTSTNKDNEIKYAAKVLTRRMVRNGNYAVMPYKKKYTKPFKRKGYEINNDIKILSSAMQCEDVILVTCDLNLYLIAKEWMPTRFYTEDKEPEYNGYKELWLKEEEIAELYSPEPKNTHNLLPNQYVVVKDFMGNKLIDLLCWTGEGYRKINDKPIDSKFFGKVKPQNGDIYQKFAIDSLRSHQLTVLRGPAGSAKSYLSLIYLYSLLEKGDITRLYIFANPVATVDAAQLGFYAGSRTEKLMDSQTGNFLISKFGDPAIVEELIDKGKIMLLPFADIRGVSVPSGSAMYITEGQNTNIPLMKLALQRVEQDVKVVIEGDEKAQVDLRAYKDKNNGLKRLSQIFRGQPFYSEVYLRNNYRSEISKTAERM